jgi:uncharacterized membrane protein
MSLTALTEAPVAIQLHAALAIVSFLLGPFALLRVRRDRLHKGVGYTWVFAMYGTAVSSLFISENPMFGPFSPIHILTFITFGGLSYALLAAWRGQSQAHGRAMRALYAQALIIPGVFTFLPGRRMNVLFGSGQDMAVFWVALAFGGVAMAVIWFHPALTRAVGLGGPFQGRLGRKIPLFFVRSNR